MRDLEELQGWSSSVWLLALMGATACGNSGVQVPPTTTAAPAAPSIVGNLPAAPAQDANTWSLINPALNPSCPQPANANDFFGAPRCCNTQAVVCEDFEGATPGQNPNSRLWTVQLSSPNDTLEVSNAMAARGSQSLHISAPNVGGERAVIVNTSLFPAPNQVFFGRAFIYFNVQHPNNHTTYAAAGPDPQSSYEWIRYSTFGNGSLGGNDSGPDNSGVSGTQLPTGRWACLEWQFDAINKKASYWLDGQVVYDNFDFSVDTTTITFGQVFIGWEIYTQDGTQPKWDMYYDEIALDYKRIGCAN